MRIYLLGHRYAKHRRWNVFYLRGGGTPSQEGIEKIFNAATICHGGSTLHIPIYKIPRILATVFAWRHFFETFYTFLLYLGFTKLANSGPHRPRPVPVNVRGPKESLVRAKGNLGDPKDIFGTSKSSEDLQKISLRSERALGVTKEMFLWCHMVMGQRKETLVRSERAVASLKRC